jgi:hypothetical protein
LPEGREAAERGCVAAATTDVLAYRRCRRSGASIRSGQGADARVEAREKEEATRREEWALLDVDIGRFCQEIAFQLSRLCSGLRLDETAVQVWLCNAETNEFERRWRFFLPYQRKPSGITWRKGLGVAGAAWEQGRDLAVDLVGLKALSEAQFTALSEADRYGMSYKLVQSSAYTGIIATRIFAVETKDTLLGMLVIDYVGTNAFICLQQAIGDPTISSIIGSCGRRLAEATFVREDN